jgi:uncharacterized membrane protein YfcA
MSVWGSLAVGLVAGFLSGTFGIGGGILIVPGLVMMGMGQRRAHGTSLGAAIPISLSAVIGFAVADKVDWAAAAPITAGAVVGALIGTRALRRLSTRALRLVFTAALLATAVRMLMQVGDGAGRGEVELWMVGALLLLGLVAGILAGLLGVGGGIVIVPVMVILFALPSAVAKGTSLAVIVPTAMVGTLENLRHRNIDVRASALVGIGGVASAFAASLVSVNLDSDVSNDLFAALLVLISVRMGVTAIRGRSREPVDLPAEP